MVLKIAFWEIFDHYQVGVFGRSSQSSSSQFMEISHPPVIEVNWPCYGRMAYFEGETILQNRPLIHINLG